MSILETVILPAIIRPLKNVTFIIKTSLLKYPVFKHIMLSTNPIALTRTDPRTDFKTVMREGQDRLGKGISLIVFPQTTRTDRLIPEQFSTIGVKLALKGKVPIVPMALLTDAWGNGKLIKDFGKIDTSKKVYISFGEPIDVSGKGADEHKKIINFIEEKHQLWRKTG